MPERFAVASHGDTAQLAKSRAALSSILAAIVLTALKLAVGLLTGSLGILAEAAHSALDLVAAALTFVAVRLAGQPPDAEHRYGHGKAENLSAFVEALLLVITAAWVIYEAVQRIFFETVHVQATVWAFLVMAISIVIDVGRSRVLGRVARETNSQALAADALHFRTDIWSSAVVIAGLAIIKLGELAGWGGNVWLSRADAFAALGVSGIVLFVTWQLARETVDALLDRAPGETANLITAAVEAVPGVVDCRQVRVRHAGNTVFADVVIAVARTATFGEAHAITEAVEDAVRQVLSDPATDVIVHMEPVAAPNETPEEAIRILARQVGMRAHDIRLRALDDRLDADLHVEFAPTLTLDQAHALTTEFERVVRATNPRFGRVNTHLEAPGVAIERQTDVTTQRAELVARARDIADSVAGAGSCHEVRLYQPPQDQRALEMVLHCWFSGEQTVSQVHDQAAEIERRLHNAFPKIRDVLLHAEPATAATPRTITVQPAVQPQA
jgi:cation diffusion facilitator family transporter